MHLLEVSLANLASPSMFAAVSTNTYYFNLDHEGRRKAARGVFSDAAGTITVERLDGTTIAVPVVAGMNLFQHTRVTANAGGLALVWFE